MTSLSKTQVLHIAKLARLKLSDAEAEKFSTELSSILQYVAMLQEVDTKDVETAANVTGAQNAFRPDVITAEQATPDALLACSPLPIIDRQIQTASAHG